MQPADLKDKSFEKYPPQARAFATKEVSLLQELPLSLAPILLRELISYDWKMPAERRELKKQFTYLSALSPSERIGAMAGFRDLNLSKDLAARDWVNDPSGFMEALAASLWSTHQMDQFHSVADAYSKAVNAKVPDQEPAKPRLGIVIIGAGTKYAERPLFQKLKPFGIRLTAVKPDDGVAILLAEAARRAASNSVAASTASGFDSSFQHWYIDGGSGTATPDLTQVFYANLAQPRAMLLGRIQRAISSGEVGPEQLRTLMTRMKPAEIGLNAVGTDDVLNHFQMTLLTEGSGTQIFATTFVQWAARECIRRAHPETLFVRYAPRQQAQTMNMMLSGASPAGADPEGSLIDADLGAYYTWINMCRLTGADQLRFLVWFEGHPEAIAIGPGLARGTTSDSPLAMQQVLNLVLG
ncbi:MAG: hypothetical protein ABI197_03815 [Granulicella sp.]